MEKSFSKFLEIKIEGRDFQGNKLSVGDTVKWKDKATKKQFMAPALGYGEGPFVILGFGIRQGRLGMCVKIKNLKGEKREVSSDLFIKI